MAHRHRLGHNHHRCIHLQRHSGGIALRRLHRAADLVAQGVRASRRCRADQHIAIRRHGDARRPGAHCRQRDAARGGRHAVHRVIGQHVDRCDGARGGAGQRRGCVVGGIDTDQLHPANALERKDEGVGRAIGIGGARGVFTGLAQRIGLGAEGGQCGQRIDLVAGDSVANGELDLGTGRNGAEVEAEVRAMVGRAAVVDVLVHKQNAGVVFQRIGGMEAVVAGEHQRRAAAALDRGVFVELGGKHIPVHRAAIERLDRCGRDVLDRYLDFVDVVGRRRCKGMGDAEGAKGVGDRRGRGGGRGEGFRGNAIDTDTGTGETGGAGDRIGNAPGLAIASRRQSIGAIGQVGNARQGRDILWHQRAIGPHPNPQCSVLNIGLRQHHGRHTDQHARQPFSPCHTLTSLSI